MNDKNLPLPRRYARSLANHGYGHALYEPTSSQEIFPASCGYLNSEGTWNPILNLSNKETLGKHGISPCILERAPQTTRDWGPKTSSNVKQTKIDLKGDISLVPAGIPADVGALFQYEVSKEAGTILLTKPPITKESLYHEEPFKRWVKENARIIATVWPDVLEYGLFIVTSTYSTDEAQINLLSSNSQKISIGFNSGFVPIGEIAPSTMWHTASADSGWIKVSAENGDDGNVVFFGGLYFRWRVPSITTSHTRMVSPDKWKHHFRSVGQDPTTITIPALEVDGKGDGTSLGTEAFEIVCEPVGTEVDRLADKPLSSRWEDTDDF